LQYGLIFQSGMQQLQRRTITLTIGPAPTDPLGNPLLPSSPRRGLNGERAPTRCPAPGTDEAASGAHPHSDVVLDKWLPAIKSIRRDMALSRRVMLDALRGPAIYVLPRDRDPSPSEASAWSTFRSPGRFIRFIGSRCPDLSLPSASRFAAGRRIVSLNRANSFRRQSQSAPHPSPSPRNVTVCACVPAFGHSRDR